MEHFGWMQIYNSRRRTFRLGRIILLPTLVAVYATVLFTCRFHASVSHQTTQTPSSYQPVGIVWLKFGIWRTVVWRLITPDTQVIWTPWLSHQMVVCVLAEAKIAKLCCGIWTTASIFTHWTTTILLLRYVSHQTGQCFITDFVDFLFFRILFIFNICSLYYDIQKSHFFYQIKGDKLITCKGNFSFISCWLIQVIFIFVCNLSRMDCNFLCLQSVVSYLLLCSIFL